MRRFIFILMIALLPLRGWMGEAMATQMATTNLIASQAINTPAGAAFDTKTGTSPLLSSMSAMPAGCEMHANAALDSADASAPTKTCTDCQSCHAAGLLCTVHIISGITTHNPAPAAHVSLFVSANLALGQKPPIL
jgi:hypothetical protein